MTNPGRLIIISAPSGAGKGTVISLLRRLRPELQYSVSATTRAPRAGEVDGTHYYFVTSEKFEEMQARDEFLECETYVGNNYGTPVAPILRNIENGIDTILEIEVKGARVVAERMPEALTIFILPPSEAELRRRLSARGTDSEEAIENRLATAKVEMLSAEDYTYTVINDIAEHAAKEILRILDSNRKNNR